MMKRRFLGLLVIAGLCFVTCGNEPPPDFYNGTPEDDDKINDILDNDYPELLVTGDQFMTQYAGMTIPEVDFPQEDSFFRVDSPLVQVHVDSIADSLSEFHRFADLWYAKDTSCTVWLFDTFDVSGMIHVDIRYTAHFDLPETTATGDTIWRIGTTDIDSTPTDDYEDYNGVGLRYIFLEPVRSTTPTIDPETEDTIGYAIIEPFEWELRRISYGTYYFPARGTDIPVIDYVVLETDTIFAYDTVSSFTGHAMNRFKHIDSLLTYTADTTLSVEVVLDGDIDAGDCVFFASSGAGWEELIDGTGTLTVTGSDITNLYFKVITRESYYYYFPNRGYFAVAWLIPVRLN
jgi:hypothetical protein